MRWRYNLNLPFILPFFISLISRTAWDSLEKPVKTFSSEHIQKCGNLCTGIPGDCDTFHYDHWHQLCSTAKVGISSPLLNSDLSALYQQVGCIASDHQVRDKRESEGDNPCTAQGEIGVYVFNEIKYCKKKHFIKTQLPFRSLFKETKLYIGL